MKLARSEDLETLAPVRQSIHTERPVSTADGRGGYRTEPRYEPPVITHQSQKTLILHSAGPGNSQALLS